MQFKFGEVVVSPAGKAFSSTRLQIRLKSSGRFCVQATEFAALWVLTQARAELFCNLSLSAVPEKIRGSSVSPLKILEESIPGSDRPSSKVQVPQNPRSSKKNTEAL